MVEAASSGNSWVAQMGPASISAVACRIVTPHISSSFVIAQSSEDAPRSSLIPGCTIRQTNLDQIASGIAALSIGAIMSSGAWSATDLSMALSLVASVTVTA